MTAADLHIATRNSFPHPNYTYLKEVRDATGFDAVRSADALAIGMYRSCGRLIHGFEMKVTRSDWLKELKDASKAESLMRYCHRWSLIVPDEKIVHDGELPPTWGLGVVHQSRANANPKIRWIVKPPELEPIPPSMVFLTALIYAAQKIDQGERDKELRLQRDEGYKRGKEEAQRSMGDLGKLKALVDAFEKTSGVHIGHWDRPENMEEKGVNFREWLITRGKVDQYSSQLRGLLEQADRIGESIRSIIQKQKLIV